MESQEKVSRLEALPLEEVQILPRGPWLLPSNGLS